MSDKPKSKLPPIGIMPKWAWDELRADNLCEAIHRYNQAGHPVPQAWVDELKALMPTIRIDYVPTTE